MGRRRSEAPVDTLPELFPYRDDGCHVHPHCLTCPLPRCIYDEPGLQRQWRQERDRQLLEMYRSGGIRVETLARRFGLSKRTVFRVLARARGAGELERA